MENWGELTRDDGGVLDARWDLISPLEKKAEELDAFEVTRKGRTGSFPLVFVGVNGKQDNTVDSPSFFNRAEAVKVRAWILAGTGLMECWINVSVLVCCRCVLSCMHW